MIDTGLNNVGIRFLSIIILKSIVNTSLNLGISP